MEIIFSKKEGIPELFEEMKKKKKSAISNDSIDVFVGADGSAVFYPKSARVAAFSLSVKDMDLIAEEAIEKALDDEFCPLIRREKK